MTCCTSLPRARPEGRRGGGEAGREFNLLVPGVHCAGCIARIENGLMGVPGVDDARLNLTTRRLNVRLDASGEEDDVISAVEGMGYDCRPFDAAAAGASAEDKAGRELLRAMAVAGFAAGNVMLLSVSVWSGAEAATRDLFHWISALIALPAIAIAGRPFFRSAWRALSARSLNMDVPISLAVILAGVLSTHAVIQSGEEAFFDAAVMLLFFLLVGRYLDHRVRARARSAVSQLLSLWAAEATRIRGGAEERVKVEEIVEGDLVRVAAGERVPVDGVLLGDKAEIDRSLVTGESDPVVAAEGETVQAGVMNLTRPMTLRVTATGEDTWLAQVVRLMEDAESGRAKHVRLADRAAKIYAPAVHLAAALTFAGWMLAGAAWGEALWIAVSVLIITCPCALGLAVPAVQVVASGALFREGILVKDGGALERLAEADSAVFDKTGTLTMGRPAVTGCSIPETLLPFAVALARQSRHPLSLAFAEHMKGQPAPELEGISEQPGQGLEGLLQGRVYRLGSRAFAGPAVSTEIPDGPEIWLSVDGRAAGRVTLIDALRPEARETVATLTERGYAPMLLSGDNEAAVARAASEAGIERWSAALRPEQKIATLEDLKARGGKPLMVGDGINDGPALAAAHVSIAPASASDVGRAAADLIFTGDSLAAVTTAIGVARKARSLVLQNFAIAAVYNAIAIPVAVLGGASPLVAAIAMSGSSVVVTLNALRLRRRRAPAPAQTAGAPAIPKEASA